MAQPHLVNVNILKFSNIKGFSTVRADTECTLLETDSLSSSSKGFLHDCPKNILNQYN